MNYENAKKGISKLYVGELLELISTILLAVCLGEKINYKDFSGLNGLLIVTVVVADVLVVVAFFKSLRGIIIASKDEKNFKIALYIIIFQFVLTILIAILSANKPNSSLNLISTLLENLVDLFITILIISGISNIFRKKGNDEMVQKGRKVIIYYTIASIIVEILRVVKMVVKNDNVKNFTGGILAILLVVFAILAGIKYLKYLYDSKKVL